MRFILFSIVFLSLSLHAQVFLNESGEIFGDKPYFNPQFVKKAGIRSMRGEYTTKAELDYIRPTSHYIYYEFDQNGNLTLEEKNPLHDTISIQYHYNQQSRLSSALKQDKYGYHYYTFKYDEKGRTLKNSYFQQRFKGSERTTFDLDAAELVSEENFEYVELSPILYKKVYLNQAGIGYKEEFFHLNEKQKLLRQEANLKNGSGRTETSYLYDKQGRLTEKSSLSKMVSRKTNKYEYDYDSFGNVLAIREYKNEDYTREYQLVYRSENQSLKAIIRREVANNFLTILKFSEYNYYPG
ncbi:MAG: hypothetical protein MI810_03975 [Flavobacteriales bacterium]|nr:hypothetical protein [Flavobacteriales bacterium]